MAALFARDALYFAALDWLLEPPGRGGPLVRGLDLGCRVDTTLLTSAAGINVEGCEIGRSEAGIGLERIIAGRGSREGRSPEASIGTPVTRSRSVSEDNQ